jgi:hypothetical protein
MAATLDRKRGPHHCGVLERSGDRACQILGKKLWRQMQTVELTGPCPQLFSTEQDTEALPAEYTVPRRVIPGQIRLLARGV